MLRFASLALALTLAACGAGQICQSRQRQAGAQKLTVFTGGTIYTGNPDLPTVDAVVVGEDGRIVGTAPPLSEDWERGRDRPRRSEGQPSCIRASPMPMPT
jgi:hypothetical protein